MTFDSECLRTHIPFYLTSDPAKRELVENLDALLRGVNTGFYISAARDIKPESVLQGDGWLGCQLFLFDSGERRIVRGIILSNTCDISPENRRDIPQKMVFAPILRLSKIEERFRGVGLAEEKIREKISSFRRQAVSNVFFLPAGGPLDEDCIVLLDDLHSMPLSVSEEGRKLFTLSMAGFYLFAFKLSIHFCRLRENVDRRSNDIAV